MLQLLQIQGPELDKIFWGDQDKWFLVEVLVRTLIMYLVVLFGLRLMGKRGVRQLTVFELVVIIGLGSAAGDPMFYKEVGVLSAIVVFVTVIAVYRLTTYLTAKSKKVEAIIEGQTVCLIEEGAFCLDSFKKEDLAQDEFFSELRVRGVSQLGQVDRAYLEVSGQVSVFFFTEEATRPGLPILPHEYKQQLNTITESGLYACTNCGHTEKITAGSGCQCRHCKKEKWVKAVDRRRIA
ncbi:MAG: DUF421 domain-containing protein [Candidatus Pseudobacter hemicellulosilyticus]|uniref:DUF421 domain-containing protein n=1 Tax=Candidatus Pseudobacter hemicellulosilyticus TaxID=3121375 RepID=A0AAJ5WUC5_9BACT|nr:MAG: DUF421 domain-containing protein [Pseudobacter sp.]